MFVFFVFFLAIFLRRYQSSRELDEVTDILAASSMKEAWHVSVDTSLEELK